MAGDKEIRDAGSKHDTSPDVNSPLYIHASDYPKQMQVNGVLTDNNYANWSQEMVNFLFAKNKIGFIDGSIRNQRRLLWIIWHGCVVTPW